MTECTVFSLDTDFRDNVSFLHLPFPTNLKHNGLAIGVLLLLWFVLLFNVLGWRGRAN